jgi:hypothetical protein
MIAAPRIDDERVGAKRRRQQALGDVACGIARDHHQRNGKRCARTILLEMRDFTSSAASA